MTVKYSEEFARKLGFQTMVLHARETAVPFYEQLVMPGSEIASPK
jgi:hypothetical protein